MYFQNILTLLRSYSICSSQIHKKYPFLDFHLTSLFLKQLLIQQCIRICHRIRTVPNRTISYRTVFRFSLYRNFFKIVYPTVPFSAFIAKIANRTVRKGNYFPFYGKVCAFLCVAKNDFNSCAIQFALQFYRLAFKYGKSREK